MFVSLSFDLINLEMSFSMKLFNVFFSHFSAFFIFACIASSCSSAETSSSAIPNDCVESDEKVQNPPNPCPPSTYRSATGECNNINQRNWGSRGDIFLRIFDPSYGNSVNSPRKSTGGNELPPPMDVLTTIRSQLKAKDASPHMTSLVPLWGHLLFRDIASFSTYTTNSTCCTQQDEINPNCFVNLGNNCKEYTRTIAKQEVKNCKFGK